MISLARCDTDYPVKDEKKPCGVGATGREGKGGGGRVTSGRRRRL